MNDLFEQLAKTEKQVDPAPLSSEQDVDAAPLSGEQDVDASSEQKTIEQKVDQEQASESNSKNVQYVDEVVFKDNKNRERTFTLSKAKPESIDEIENLIANNLPKASRPPRDYLEWSIAVPQCHVLIVHEKDEKDEHSKIVACSISLAQKNKELTETFGHIQILLVDPTARRLGICAQIVMINEMWFSMFGAHYALLYIEKRNSVARQCANNLGYTQKHIERDYYDKGNHACLMQKKFNQSA